AAIFFFFCLTPFILKAEDQHEYTLAVTDITGLEELQREFHKFQDVLSQRTGLKFKLFPVTSRTTAVEAMTSKKLDFVLTGPAEYVVMRKKTNGNAVVGFARPDYFSSIIVLESSGIRSAEDLKGKKIALGDFGSTSYHLAPMQLLKDYGLDPNHDVKAVHVSKNIAWDALKKGNVDAVGLNYDRFLLLRDSDKQMTADKFRVVARGPDLPNDVIMAGAHVSSDVLQKVKKAFAENGVEFGQAILAGARNAKYKEIHFLTNISDKDYNYVRSMYTTIGYPEFAEFLG
ncbi:MAG: phosphate/phosphite/phosphonate ABC transporter substrate-binding protein, partial [Bdellovibrionales bacterium]|nr:phosphate/phosphite/phosphonate ABC transporter substrate-binding protein [Bdellovibrionales bacterium]